MKKIFFTLALSTIVCGAFSQALKNSIAYQNQKRSPAAIINSTDDNTTAMSGGASVKAIKSFKKSFKNINNEKWYEMPDGYRVKFTANGAHSNIFYKVDYDNKGNWLHTIRSYDEKELPGSIRDQIRMTYLDYKIATVDELNLPGNQTTFIIHLEGTNDWINVEITDGQMDELQRYNK